MKFSGLFPPVLTEKDDKTISLSSILGFEILSEKLLMLGSVDGILFQEKIENANSGISDSLICIPSKNGANDDFKFLEKFFWVGEKRNGPAFFSSFHSQPRTRHMCRFSFVMPYVVIQNFE